MNKSLIAALLICLPAGVFADNGKSDIITIRSAAEGASSQELYYKLVDMYDNGEPLDVDFKEGWYAGRIVNRESGKIDPALLIIASGQNLGNKFEKSQGPLGKAYDKDLYICDLANRNLDDNGFDNLSQELISAISSLPRNYQALSFPDATVAENDQYEETVYKTYRNYIIACKAGINGNEDVCAYYFKDVTPTAAQLAVQPENDKKPKIPEVKGQEKQVTTPDPQPAQEPQKEPVTYSI